MGQPNLKIPITGTIVAFLAVAIFNIGGFYLDWKGILPAGEDSTILGLSSEVVSSGCLWASVLLFLLLLIQLIRLLVRSARIKRELDRLQNESEMSHLSNQELIQHVSHKIRTPLSTLTTSLEMLKDTEVLDYQVDPINIMDSSLDAINVLVNDVVDTTSIEDNGIQLNYELVTLNEFLESLYIGIRPLAQANGLILNFNWPKDENIGIDTDSLRLRQIVYNVLYNLIGFNEEGVVSLNVVPAYGENDVIQLQFMFSGAEIGMDTAQLEEFRTFISDSTAPLPSRPRFLDIGLYNSAVIVRKMGGAIGLKVSMEEGIRLTITISFPLYYSTRGGSQAAEAADQEGGGSAAFTRLSRALIVDDITVNRIMMKKVIDKLGITCDQAGSGQEALQMIDKESYELVLMDITMPDIDGVEVTRRIRTMNLKHQPVIVAVTATAVDSFRQEAEDAGMEAYITKPFRLEELKRVLKEYFDLDEAGKPRLKLR